MELHPAAKLAWQQDAKNILVFANGECQKFDESVLPSLLVLCENWRMTTSDIKAALADASTVALLDYLVDSGVLGVA